jgi:hypothetical protein
MPGDFGLLGLENRQDVSDWSHGGADRIRLELSQSVAGPASGMVMLMVV